jgi:hypothetical protein
MKPPLSAMKRELLVRLVACVLLERRRRAMRVGDRLRRDADRVLRGLRPDMREVDEDPDAVHLGHDLAAEIRQAGVAALVAPCPDHVLRVVGELDDADADLLEELHVAEPVLEGGRVLKAEDDAGLALTLGAADVLDRACLDD